MARYLRRLRSARQGATPRRRPANHLYYSMPSLLSRLRHHLARTPLFPEPGTVVVAVSGGPDSVALLDLLQQLAPEFGLALVVAHADHGIHAESGAVAAAVRQLAERWALPAEVGQLALGPGATETTARRARYAWLGEVRQRHAARYIATAHHRDDQLETILLRLLRGSAPAGLAGMAARARGGLVRPLLPFTKAELAAYVAARELPSHDDPANRDPRHLRTWVRLTLVPPVPRWAAMIPRWRWRCCGPQRAAPGWCWGCAARGRSSGSRSAPRDVACRWAADGWRRWGSIASRSPAAGPPRRSPSSRRRSAGARSSAPTGSSGRRSARRHGCHATSGRPGSKGATGRSGFRAPASGSCPWARSAIGGCGGC